MVPDFTFPGITTRVVFGAGTLDRVGDELRRLGRSRALLLSSPRQRGETDAAARSLGPLMAGVFEGAAPHTPVEVTEEALGLFRNLGADSVIAIGGGSTIGLAKALATWTGADQVAVPTTYAGSEMTDVLGQTQGGEKTTRRDPSIRPEVVIYDVDLTLSLPLGLTATSALNAIAHATEAFYAPDRNPVIELMCRSALPAFRDALPRLKEDPQDRDARRGALYAAWCCSTALGAVSMALHHKLAHVLGGSFGTPHAETHAILLPHTAAFNERAVPDLLAPIRETFGGGSAGGGLWDFAGSIGAPTRLQDLALGENDLDEAAEIAVRSPYANPRPFDGADIRGLLQAAWEGVRPQA